VLTSYAAAHLPAGPTGKILLMPEAPNSVLICVATGTGIAPFRSFWRRCFFENVPNWKFTGLLWVFMGVANSDAKLYDDEMAQISATFPDQFRLDYALSREQQNRRGGKMYIQDKVRCWRCCKNCTAQYLVV
jgi:ferredoxin--NADP+ reductase